MTLAQKIIAAWLFFPCSCLANPLELQLTQYVDADCNGILSTSTSIQPGSCIHYQIQPQTVDSMPLFNVVIKALIPEYTHFYSAAPSNTPEWQTIIDDNEIRFHIATLTANSWPGLSYTVKVDSE